MQLNALLRNPEIYWDMLNKPRQELSGCSIVHTGIQSPWLNGVVAGKPEEPASIVGFFKERETPFCWWSEAATESPRLKEDLGRFGLANIGPFTGMILNLNKLHAPEKSPLKVEIVSSLESLKAFVKVLIEVYQGEPSILDHALQLFWQAGIKTPTFHFLGKVDQIPVSVGSMYIDTDGAASLFNMGTLDRYRNRGFASHLLQSALQTAVEKRAKISCLVATPEGYQLYNRAGFDPVAAFNLFM